MSSTFSPLLRLELIGPGGQVNAWGDTTNVNLGTLIDQAIAGAVTVAIADSNVTLSSAEGQADQSRNAILLFTGSQTQPRTVTIPNNSKLYVVRNMTSGGNGLRIQRAGGGDFVEVPNGKTAFVLCDGVDVSTAMQYIKDPVIQGGTIASLAQPLPVDSGGTGAATADAARSNLEAAKSGVNSDITGLAGLLTPLAVGSGGTGATNAASARSNLQAAKSGINSDITSLTGLTAPLSLSQGGTGTNITAAQGAVLYSGATAAALTDVGVAGQVLRSNAGAAPTWQSVTGSVSVVVDGNGAAFASGIKGYVQIPFAATITAVTLLGDTTGSVVVDIWKDSFANYPPTSADSICASARPTISSGNKYTDSTLTGWTKSLAANDVLAFNIVSVLSFTKLTISLTIVRT